MATPNAANLASDPQFQALLAKVQQLTQQFNATPNVGGGRAALMQQGMLAQQAVQNYAWAHGMSNFGDLENPYTPNHWNRDIEPKHRVVLNTLWFLPLGRNSRYLSNVSGPVNQVIGGWKFAWASVMQTGQYFSPSFSGRFLENNRE